MNKILKLSTALALVIFAGTFSACKKSFDNPPGPADPAIVANTSIAALKAMHTTSGAYDIITSDIIISGIVVADDKSGNLYKQLYIQDATGGIQVLLDATNLYGSYPVGRRVFIKCKDLCISDYNRTMELGVRAMVNGAPSLEGVPGNLVSKYVIGGSLNNPVVPVKVDINQLTTGMQDPYIGSLIQLDDYEFMPSNLNKTYADTSAYKNTTNDSIRNCTAPSVPLIVRTSGYANFAGQRVAQGHGSIVAIYTVFGNTKQLIIRDTNDVQFNGPYGCPLPPGTIFFENFDAVSNNVNISLPGWKNIGEVGGVQHQGAVFGSTRCAKVTAFSTGASSVTSWLITPAINLTGTTAPKLTYLEAAGYALGATTFQVLISTNYNGSNTPSTSTWTVLRTVTATTPTTGYGTLASIGNLNLSAYIGQTVYIAFRYDGSDPTRTTTYEFDDVKVTSN